MAANDLLTLAEAKAALNIGASSTTHDTEIGLWITAVSTRIDGLCGAVVIRTVTDEPHDGGKSPLRLRKAPCSTTSATTIMSVTVDGTALAASDYEFVKRLGFLYPATSFTAGRDNVLVTYEAGRYATTAAVDPMFKLAASLVLNGMWKKVAPAWASGDNPFEGPEGGIPPFFDELKHAVNRWLGDEKRPPVVA